MDKYWICDIPKFDGNGSSYFTWKIRMEDALVLREIDAGIIKGKSQKPQSMTDQEWETMDRKALAIIRSGLTDTVLLQVFDMDTCAKLWSRLKFLYVNKSITNQRFLERKLRDLRIRNGVSVLEHVSEFNKLIVQLQAAGQDKSDDIRAFHFLRSVPDHYAAHLDRGLDPPQGFDDALKRILKVEIQWKEEDYDSAYKSSKYHERDEGCSRGTPVCRYCGKTGHQKRDCRKLN